MITFSKLFYSSDIPYDDTNCITKYTQILKEKNTAQMNKVHFPSVNKL